MFDSVKRKKISCMFNFSLLKKEDFQICKRLKTTVFIIVKKNSVISDKIIKNSSVFLMISDEIIKKISENIDTIKKARKYRQFPCFKIFLILNCKVLFYNPCAAVFIF